MPPRPKLPPDAPALRRRAEARLRATATRPPAPRTAADTQRLLHELQVHQVELELQNEELRQAREAGEAALARYTALYDGAPAPAGMPRHHDGWAARPRAVSRSWNCWW